MKSLREVLGFLDMIADKYTSIDQVSLDKSSYKLLFDSLSKSQKNFVRENGYISHFSSCSKFLKVYNITKGYNNAE